MLFYARYILVHEIPNDFRKKLTKPSKVDDILVTETERVTFRPNVQNDN